jgi:hypothetical protein
MTLNRQKLDSMECSDPNCTHECHDEFFLSGACHEGRPTLAWYKNDVISIYCSVCGDSVVQVAVTGEWALCIATPREDARGLPFHTCCDGRVTVCYKKGNLHICCYQCKSPIAMPIQVADAPVKERRRLFLQGPL